MSPPRRITHLQLDDSTRILASVRAAALDMTLTEYFSALVKADAEAAGFSQLVENLNDEPDPPNAA